MTNQAILTKAIEKAIAGGWTFRGFKPEKVRIRDDFVVRFDVPELWEWTDEDGDIHSETENSYGLSKNDIIYRHDFAKALWGEKDLMLITEDNSWKQPWQYHLQQMVIADDPIQYLGENI